MSVKLSKLINYLNKINAYIELNKDGSGVIRSEETGIHYTPFENTKELELIIKSVKYEFE